MKLSSFLLALTLGQVALSVTPDNDKCAADNCARAVTGTRTGKMPDVSSRAKDCSSFMLITVTPATSTVTATTTVTTTVGGVAKRAAAALAARQVTVVPSKVPAYATACSGTVRYSSACSCWGVTATTTTVPTPVTTTTTTVTATVTLGTCDSPQVCGGASCAGGSCACQPDENGLGQCNHPQSCDILPACTKASDCPVPGSKCLSTCCPGSVCFTPDQLCPNMHSPKMIFKKRFGSNGKRINMSSYI